MQAMNSMQAMQSTSTSSSTMEAKTADEIKKEISEKKEQALLNLIPHIKNNANLNSEEKENLLNLLFQKAITTDIHETTQWTDLKQKLDTCSQDLKKQTYDDLVKLLNDQRSALVEHYTKSLADAKTLEEQKILKTTIQNDTFWTPLERDTIIATSNNLCDINPGSGTSKSEGTSVPAAAASANAAASDRAATDQLNKVLQESKVVPDRTDPRNPVTKLKAIKAYYKQATIQDLIHYYRTCYKEHLWGWNEPVTLEILNQIYATRCVGYTDTKNIQGAIDFARNNTTPDAPAPAAATSASASSSSLINLKTLNAHIGDGDSRDLDKAEAVIQEADSLISQNGLGGSIKQCVEETKQKLASLDSESRDRGEKSADELIKPALQEILVKIEEEIENLINIFVESADDKDFGKASESLDNVCKKCEEMYNKLKELAEKSKNIIKGRKWYSHYTDLRTRIENINSLQQIKELIDKNEVVRAKSLLETTKRNIRENNVKPAIQSGDAILFRYGKFLLMDWFEKCINQMEQQVKDKEVVNSAEPSGLPTPEAPPAPKAPPAPGTPAATPAPQAPRTPADPVPGTAKDVIQELESAQKKDAKTKGKPVNIDESITALKNFFTANIDNSYANNLEEAQEQVDEEDGGYDIRPVSRTPSGANNSEEAEPKQTESKKDQSESNVDEIMKTIKQCCSSEITDPEKSLKIIYYSFEILKWIKINTPKNTNLYFKELLEFIDKHNRNVKESNMVPNLSQFEIREDLKQKQKEKIELDKRIKDLTSQREQLQSKLEQYQTLIDDIKKEIRKNKFYSTTEEKFLKIVDSLFNTDAIYDNKDDLDKKIDEECVEQEIFSRLIIKQLKKIIQFNELFKNPKRIIVKKIEDLGKDITENTKSLRELEQNSEIDEIPEAEGSIREFNQIRYNLQFNYVSRYNLLFLSSIITGEIDSVSKADATMLKNNAKRRDFVADSQVGTSSVFTSTTQKTDPNKIVPDKDLDRRIDDLDMQKLVNINKKIVELKQKYDKLCKSLRENKVVKQSGSFIFSPEVGYEGIDLSSSSSQDDKRKDGTGKSTSPRSDGNDGKTFGTPGDTGGLSVDALAGAVPFMPDTEGDDKDNDGWDD